MSVKSLIDEILSEAPGYNRTGKRGLLNLIQRAQDKLFDYDAHYMRWVGTDNEGWPTFLKTVAGTYRYDVVAANLASGSITVTLNGVAYPVKCRRVMKVFVDQTNQGYDMPFLGEPYSFQWQNPYNSLYRRIYVSDVSIDSTPSLETTSASVTFKSDPGTTTDRYFISFVWEPPRLTSESVPLVIPYSFEDAIEDYVIGMVQKRQNGRLNERLDIFEKKWVPEFRQYMEHGIAQATPTQTVRRIC